MRSCTGTGGSEGPVFLENVLRRLQDSELEAVSGSQYLEAEPVQQISTPTLSSWGEGGYFSFWLNGSNSWCYRELHGAELAMQAAARDYRHPDELQSRALGQMARELLLAQASDWAFIMKTGTTVEYAAKQTNQRVANVHKLLELLRADDREALGGLATQLWEQSPIFPNIDYRRWS